jgi:predicted  nucleic acid-binding Zn-ribbon protein
MVREQLEALRDLARIDRGFRQFDAELDELRGRLEDLRADVGRIGGLLEREKAQLSDVERMRTETAAEVLDLGERITRSTGRANVARNTRERDAATREVEVLRKERDDRVQRSTELEKGVHDVRASIERHVEDFEKLRQALAEEEVRVAERTADIERARAEITASRETITAKVRQDLLRKYEGIRSRRGTAVAEVSDGICRACHVALPPQFFAKVIAATDALQCPSCQRLLVLRAAVHEGSSP